MVGWWVEGEGHAWAAFALVLSCAILLLLPLGPWQSRRWAMSQEILRPVSREKYYRQFLGAMAMDMVTWLGTASVLIFVVVLLEWYNINPVNRLTDVTRMFALSFALLWSMAAFVYGVGVATLHRRFWLPIIAVTTIGWFVGCWYSVALTGLYLNIRSDWYMAMAFVAFPVVTAAIGLGLTLSTYRRWVRGDVV